MSTTYSPRDAAYADDADLRGELARVFDLCHGCRLCLHLCPAFPTLFRAIDAHDGRVDALDRAETDRVVDECYQCKLCYLKCPYVPPHEWQLDFPRLMLRAHAVRHARREGSLRERLSDAVTGHTDLAGALSSAVAPVANHLVSRPGTVVRRAMGAVAGIAPQRLLPPYAKQRFSTWWRRRGRSPLAEIGARPQSKVALFTTCFVEYMAPEIGRDLVRVYERNNVACTVPAGLRCCGAPWLHAGDEARFLTCAADNVNRLAAEVAAGRTVIVPEPTCAYVLKKDYPLHLGTPQAEAVAAATMDASEYLVSLHKDPGKTFDTVFDGKVPDRVAYHTACHLRAQGVGFKARDLMKLTGADVMLVQECSGIDGTWGYRAKNYDLAKKVAVPMREAIGTAMDDGVKVVMGDCHLANTAIAEETGATPLHPMQVLARAYGLDDSADARVGDARGGRRRSARRAWGGG